MAILIGGVSCKPQAPKTEHTNISQSTHLLISGSKRCVLFMEGPWIEKYNGGIYHVMAIVYNKEYIFLDNIDKEYFLTM